MTKEASNRIYWIRLICAVMIVGVHCENGIEFGLAETSTSWKVQSWISNNIFYMALPIFFILSGFFVFITKMKNKL